MSSKKSVLPYVLVGVWAVVTLPCCVCLAAVTALRWVGASDQGALAEGRAEIREYNARLAAVYPNVPDVGGPAQPCPAEVIRAGYAGRDGSGRMYIPSLRYESLARWAGSTTTASDDDAYAWLDSFERVDPDDVSDFELGDVRYRVSTHASARYLAVFRGGLVRAPVVRGEAFEAGLFVGRLYVMDTVTGQAICHASVAAQSGESVSVGGLLHEDDADDAVRSDIREQLRTAATASLRSISAELYLSTTPTIGN